MSPDELRTAIEALVDEIARRPDDRGLRERLTARLGEAALAGVDLRGAAARIEAALGGDGADELFDNMPV